MSREAVHWAERWGTKWAIQYVEAALLANAYERTAGDDHDAVHIQKDAPDEDQA
jgi:hypothetical protein